MPAGVFVLLFYAFIPNSMSLVAPQIGDENEVGRYLVFCVEWKREQARSTGFRVASHLAEKAEY